MIFGKPRGRLTTGVIVAVLVVVSIPFWRHQPPVTSNTNGTRAGARAVYAERYQAAWRQDDGVGSLLMSATVFPTELTDALHDVTDRTSLEQQQWDQVSSLPPSQLPVFLTLDSVGGAIPDTAIASVVSLTSDVGVRYPLVSWKPLVTTSHVVNAPAGTTSQVGFAVFDAGHDLAWPAVQNLTLTVKGLAGIASRKFVWPHPGTLAP